MYTGNIKYIKKLFWFAEITTTLTDRSQDAPSIAIATDNYGGGYYSKPGAITNVNSSKWLYENHITINGPISFTAIPTPSALDIGGSANTLVQADYLRVYGVNNQPAAPKTSAFANFITARDNSGTGLNEDHVTFTTRNGDWLAAELNADGTSAHPYPIADCSLSCSSGTITGANKLCGSSAVYALSNLPSNANITWSVSGDLAITGATSNTNQVTVVSTTPYNQSGIGQVKAVLSSTCGDVVLVKDVQTGLRGLPAIDGPAEVCQYSLRNMYSIDCENAIGEYTWEMAYPGPPDFTTHVGYTLSFHTAYAGTYYLVVTVPTLCGVERQEMWVTVADCGPFNYVVYPNPASNTMSVSLNSDNAAAKSSGAALTADNASTESTSKSFKIELLNSKGYVLRTAVNNGKRVLTFDTSSIPSGTYYMHITEGKTVIKKQVIINH